MFRFKIYILIVFSRLVKDEISLDLQLQPAGENTI